MKISVTSLNRGYGWRSGWPRSPERGRENISQRAIPQKESIRRPRATARVSISGSKRSQVRSDAHAPAREVAIVLRCFRHPRELAGVPEARPRDDDLREISFGLIIANMPQRRNSYERAVATTEVRDTVQRRERFGCATLGIVKISSLSLCVFMCL